MGTLPSELFELSIGDGQPQQSFLPVSGLRLHGLSLESDVVEVTSDDNGGWRRLLSGGGIRRMVVHGEGLFTSSPAELRLRELALLGASAEFELTLEGECRMRGPLVVSTLRYDATQDEEVTFSVKLESAGPILTI